MNTVTSTIDITPTPFQARIQSPPQEWDLLLDGGRGGGKTYALILGGFHLAERSRTGHEPLALTNLLRPEGRSSRATIL